MTRIPRSLAFDILFGSSQIFDKHAAIDRIYNSIDDEYAYKICKNCKYWVKSEKTPTLKRCIADNHLGLVGETFFCANFEKRKG